MVPVAIAALTACSIGGVYPPKSGQVLDWETKEPIAGAIVVATWHGGFPAVVEQQHRCYHVESATTDEQGRFRIPFHAEGPKLLIDKYRMYSAYKAGYRTAIDEGGRRHRSNYEKDGVLYLERDRRSVAERLKYLLNQSQGCGDDGSEINLGIFFKSLYDEADNIAVSKEDRLRALYLLRDHEELELGVDEAWKRFRLRKSELAD